MPIRRRLGSCQSSVCRSISIVRLAFVTSVACTPPSGPPVRFHSSQLSIVPKASSPASARARAPGTASSIQLDLRPREVGRQRQADRARAAGRARRSPASSRTSARRARVLPDDRVVERPAALAIPQHRRLALVGDPDRGDLARVDARRGERRRRSPRACGCQISSGSCSTQPACGWICSMLALVDRREPPVAVEQDQPRARRALVDGGDEASHRPNPTAAAPDVPGDAEIARTFAGSALAPSRGRCILAAVLLRGLTSLRRPGEGPRPRATAVPAASATALLGATARPARAQRARRRARARTGSRARRGRRREAAELALRAGRRRARVSRRARPLPRRRLPELGHRGAPRRAAAQRGRVRLRRRAMDRHAGVRADARARSRARDVLHDRQAARAAGPPAAAARAARRRRPRRPHASATRTSRSAATSAGQLESTIEAIRALSGYTPCVFRPPYGAYDPAVLRTARSLGLATVLWDVDPADYSDPGVGAIEQRVLAQVRPGSIVISHDGGGPRRTDAGRLPRDHRQAARARLQDRDRARTARVPAGLRAVREALRRDRRPAPRAAAQRDPRCARPESAGAARAAVRGPAALMHAP